MKAKANSGLRPARAAPPQPSRFLCVRSVTLAARLCSGDAVDVLRLPSGLCLVRLGEYSAVIDESVLVANFKEV